MEYKRFEPFESLPDNVENSISIPATLDINNGLNLKSLNWTSIAGDVDIKRDRAENYEDAVLLYDQVRDYKNDYGIDCLCMHCEDMKIIEDDDDHEIKKCGNCNNIAVIKRIGSTSVEGEAFLIGSPFFRSTTLKMRNESSSPSSPSFVMKVMPYLNNMSQVKNENEIKISAMVSNLVLEGISPHFIISLGSSVCEHTEFAPESSLGISAVEYAMRQYLISKFLLLTTTSPPAIVNKRLNLISKQTSTRPLEDFIAESFKLLKLNDHNVNKLADETRQFILNNGVKADLLFLELAWGDLNQFILHYESNLNEQPLTWFWFLQQGCQAIADLQTHLNVIQNDLHLGNVFILFDNSQLYVLIGDFGKSRIIQDDQQWTNDDRKRDLELFIDSLHKRAPTSFKFLNDLFDMLEKQVVEYKGTDNLAATIAKYLNDLLEKFVK